MAEQYTDHQVIYMLCFVNRFKLNRDVRNGSRSKTNNDIKSNKQQINKSHINRK